MTDEERGRMWCERNGRKPDRQRGLDGRPMWRWVYDDGTAYAIPHVMWDVLRSTWFAREEHAYDAVGAALRELEAKAADIRAVLECGEVSLYSIRPLVWVPGDKRDVSHADTACGRCTVRPDPKGGWVVIGHWQSEHHRQSREAAIQTVERWHREALLKFLTSHSEQPCEGGVI